MNAAASSRSRATAVSAAPPSYDVERVRADFPILAQRVHGKPLVYLDNAATSQTPRAVIDALVDFHERDRSNIHRGVHELSARATAAYEAARETVQRFLGARETREVIFVRGTTEAVNLVANSWGLANVGAGDEVVVSEMEHHSNFVPWQLLCQRVGARLRLIPVTDDGRLDLDAFDALLGPRTKIVAVAHVSNALGTINPVETIIERAHAAGALVLLDGAQAVPHMPVDVAALDCDFYACSGHKLYGPMGIGVLVGRAELLQEMPPYEGGGGMIRSVTVEKTTFAPPPARFEAGTPNVAGAIGLAAACDYLDALGGGAGMHAVAAHEQSLTNAATEALAGVEGLRILGPTSGRAAVFSLVLDPIHPHDLGTILDQHGVAIRAGHHCTQPLMRRLGVGATARASFGLYNTLGEVEALVDALNEARRVFGLPGASRGAER